MTQQYPPPPPGPYGPPQYGPPAQPPPTAKKRRRRWPWIVGVPIGLFLALLVLVGVTAPPTPSTPAEPLAPAKSISARDWQLIAKDPTAHVGERVIVFGDVAQFDAATGATTFRANVDGVEHKPEYGVTDYPTNMVLTGEGDLLKPLVQGDLFKAEVTVAGANSYDTQIGGSTTAPELTVTQLDVIGHT
jgi:hypothetical protein